MHRATVYLATGVLHEQAAPPLGRWPRQTARVLFAATDQRSVERRSMPATIEIDVHRRLDAIALLQRLNPYRPYLVQFAPEQWLVHAEAPGCHGERLPSALAAIDESLAARHVEDAAVRIDGRPYRPPSGGRRPS
jgi:hypothetical protein